MSELRPSPLAEIAERQRMHLIAYLSRVQSLPAPDRDLVFLHSEVGVAAGIPAAVGDRLAEMARNGQTEGLADVFADQSQAFEEAVISNLARWVDAFGLLPERENALKVLIGATTLATQIAPQTMALSAGTIIGFPGQLPDGAIGDAVRVAQKCSPTQRHRLLTKLRSRKDLYGDPAARLALVAASNDLETNADLARGALLTAISERDQLALEAAGSLGEKAQADLFAGVDTPVREWAKKELAGEQEKAAESEEEAPVSQVVDRLTFAFDVLQDSAPAVVMLATALLALQSNAADDEVGHRLSTLSPVTDSALALALLTRTRARPPSVREIWLASVDPKAVSEDASPQLDALANQAWSELIAPDSNLHEYDELLDLLGSLTPPSSEEYWNFPELEASIAGALESPMHDDATAAERLRLVEIIDLFIARDLVERSAVADRFIDACASAMAVLPTGELDQLPETRRAVGNLLAIWLDDASPDSLRRLNEAATQEPEAQLDVTKAEARLGAVGQLRQSGDDLDPPLDPGVVARLIVDHGERAKGPVLNWLHYFAADLPLWALLRPLWPIELSQDVLTDFDHAVRHLSPGPHRALAEAAIAETIERGMPPAGNWQAIALRELKATSLVEMLATSAPEDVSDTERWRRLLAICRERAPGSNAKVLVAERLLTPMMEGDSAETFDLALEHLELIGKKNTQRLLESLSLSTERRAQVDAKIAALDWNKGTMSRLLDTIRGDSS